MNKEPAALSGIISAILTLASAFGVAFTDDQVQAILLLATFVVPAVGGFITRHLVSPASETISLDFYLSKVAELEAEIATLKKRRATKTTTNSGT